MSAAVSFSIRVFLALLAGVLLGLLISESHLSWLAPITGFLEPIGSLFINAIRLTVIPLVVTSLIVGAASIRDAEKMSRLGRSALFCILAGIFIAAGSAVAVAIPVFERIQVDSKSVAALNRNASSGLDTVIHTTSPSLAQWFVDLVPVNIFKAAADGSLLPLVVVALAFGLALTKVETSRRQLIVNFFGGVADAFLILVGFIVRLAPLGVFALAVPLAAHLGLAAASAVGIYVVVMSAINAAQILILYPLTALLGNVPPRKFAVAIAPAQGVAFSSRSSMAALPAAFAAAQLLELQPVVYEFFLPLAASIFRIGGAAIQVTGVVFLARFYGIELHISQILHLTVLAALTSMTAPGVPGGGILVMAPVLTALNIPGAGLGILLAVDTIPDMFRTTANVTAWISTAVFLNRWNSEKPVT